VAAASLWLRSAVPVWAIVAPHDDFLFLRLAYNLGGGLWLGQFDNLTLAKGMAYPAFILAAFLAGIPLKIANSLPIWGRPGLPHGWWRGSPASNGSLSPCSCCWRSIRFCGTRRSRG